MKPSSAGTCTSATCSSTSWRSGLTTCSKSVSGILTLQRLRFFLSFFDGTHHVEGLLRHVVVLAVDDFLESSDRIGQFHVFTGESRELLGNVEGLREEPLDLAGARHCQLVI